ncbi:hypothetical protein [Alcaligenes faecalis]|uniref:hypothetical protein n=1 Tax=Alcaligenes faecalis TaxID=511 RepID=UPI0021503EE9|nr:hypothetical protein [Alcaligenes faecalis]MCR4143671.1 hypothetical protein [Alcaligenes faecalis]WGQ35353.1 hypothetical protein QEZ63_16015 [Alcaligenes faecalis]
MTTTKPKSKNAQRLDKYKATMTAHGFQRMSFYGCAELVVLLDKERQRGECLGRTLERLLLGKAVTRPDYWTREELAQRAMRQSIRGGNFR